MKLIGSREFNQDVSEAKRLARVEPVVVTDRGRPTHVLMAIDTFRQMAGESESLAAALAMTERVDLDWRSCSPWRR